MIDPAALLENVTALGLSPQAGVSLAKLGYWRLGGPAQVYVEVGTAEALAGLLSLGAPITVLGNGSNLLVSDRGIPGLTLRLTGDFRGLEVDRDGWLAWAGGGLLNAVLLRRLASQRLGGLACLAGVPGTVGGALRLNAGTALGEIGAAVRAVEVALPGGAVEVLPPASLGFAYRRATLPPGAVVTRALLAIGPEGFDEEQAAIAHHLARRKATQPLDLPSCGSVFKNPPGDFAGRLIEAAGLKGEVRGGAQVSPRHANFIVNNGGATAADVLALIRLARDTVAARFGVALEPEVHAVGAWSPEEWPLPPWPGATSSD